MTPGRGWRQLADSLSRFARPYLSLNSSACTDARGHMLTSSRFLRVQLKLCPRAPFTIYTSLFIYMYETHESRSLSIIVPFKLRHPDIPQFYFNRDYDEVQHEVQVQHALTFSE